MNTISQINIAKVASFNPARKLDYVFLVVLGLGFAVSLSAVNQDYFIGNWLNVNQATRGIMAIQMGRQNGQADMRAWGACSPTPCKWGQTRMSFLAPSVSSQEVSEARAVFVTGFSRTELTLRPVGNGMLRVESMTHFTDNSGRSDYTETETFRRVGWDQWDRNLFN